MSTKAVNSVVYNISNVPEAGKYFPLGQHIQNVQFGNLAPVNTQNNNKIILIGDPFVGKTTLVGCMKTNNYQQDYYATIGVAYVQIDCSLNSHDIKLNIWDTAGQEKTNALTKAYYRGANFACICFAYDDPKSFKNVHSWYSQIKENSGNDLNGIFLIGCKSDLEHKISDEEIAAICKQYKLEFFETSAKEKTNVEKLVKRLCYIGILMQQVQSHAKKVVIVDTVDIAKEQPKSQKDEKCKC
ncbi:Ras-related protein YPTC6 [Tritrichomonas foetus]|uniref:Ras-related protein YPTC6 n=1 Tax=Tritrichomonas foetus TaxID=1144522 RepID=A0A1J4K2K1_9EUKA|nr:Ras-related protein YPTC6 [Tritrichomonas foetus]|eukprot:OHT05194.1 Ras-related protein YPTC6 [Tritrichomonas foetus]